MLCSVWNRAMLSSSAWTDNCGEGMVAGFTLSLLEGRRRAQFRFGM